MKTIFLIFLLLALPVTVFATPSGVTPSANTGITHGQSLTITGSSFLTKSTAAPLLFDKTSNVFTSLTNGQALPTGGGNSTWTGDNDAHYNTTNLRHSHVTADYYSANSYHNYVDGFNFSGTPNQWYASWWFMSNARTGKYSRIANSADQVNETMTWGGNPLSNPASYIYWNGGYCTCSNSSNCGSNGSYDYGSPQDPPANQWNFMEILWDNQNHTYQTKINGVTNNGSAGPINYAGTASGSAVSCPSTTMNQIWKIGLDDNGTNLQNSHTGEIYIDSTFSRVMLGDASTYANSRHFEMQPPTSWATGSISINVNQGSFANGSTAYLYVVDSAGAVNSDGAAITFGSGGVVNGACGSSNGQSFSSVPSTNLCSTGTPTTVLGTGTPNWHWDCTGSNGGSSTSGGTCIATLLSGGGTKYTINGMISCNGCIP